MTDALFQLNPLAIVAATLVHVVLGGVWYTVLFGRAYAASLGLDAPPASPPPGLLVGSMACSAVTITTTAWLQRALEVTSYRDAVGLGAVVGVGYLAAMTLNIALNPLFPRPVRYAVVNAPMFVIGSLLASLVLVALP